MTKKDKLLFGFLLAAMVLSSILPLKNWYLKNTEIAPAFGGTYTEAAIGSPRYLNPVLAAANDVDRDISMTIYSSLVKRNGNGEMALDLAEKYIINEERTTYDFYLKKDAKWHDGKQVTADDVVFTALLIQNPDYKSPLRTSLQGVDIERVDDFTVRFRLRSPYGPFLDNLTFGILPKHVWENVSPSNFPLTEFNLRPMGSGPYAFEEIQKDTEGKIRNIKLSAFEDYFSGKPNIKTLIFRFYKNEDEAISAFNKGNADGISFVSAKNAAKITRNYQLNEFVLPRYFAVFFNQDESEILAEKDIREALTLATDKEGIIKDIVAGQAVEIDSPLPQFIFDLQSARTEQKDGSGFDPEKAAELLEENDWTFPEIETEEGTTTLDIRYKEIDDEEIPLEVSLLTVNWPELVEVANRIKIDWEKTGIRVNLDVKPTTEIQEKIRDRQYQALLFGQILNPDPDPFAFWHSSQKKDPGLNLALYEDKDADKLLEKIRQEIEPEKKLADLNEFQKIVTEDIPAIFLYSPVYLFPTDPTIQGIEIKNGNLPSVRFAEVGNWHIKTKRVWK